MAQITITGTVRADGMLTARVPVTLLPGTYQIIVVVDAETTDDWPAGYFEETFGSIPEANLERGPQGDYEQREDMPSSTTFVDWLDEVCKENENTSGPHEIGGAGVR